MSNDWLELVGTQRAACCCKELGVAALRHAHNLRVVTGHSFGVTISPTKSMQSLEYVCTTHPFKALHTVHSVQVYSQYNFQTFRIYCSCYSDPHDIPNHLTFPLDLCS